MQTHALDVVVGVTTTLASVIGAATLASIGAVLRRLRDVERKVDVIGALREEDADAIDLNSKRIAKLERRRIS